MEIIVFDELPSTQLYLREQLELERLKSPVCVVAKRQKAGIGSRGNTWEQVRDALMFSFSMQRFSLPQDLPIQSASIFFGFIFKQTLVSMGFDVWLKWPNDIYLKDKKIGGVLVNIYRDEVICGIGLNIDADGFASLQQKIDKMELLEKFFEKIKNTLAWKDIFSKYELEFYKNLGFGFHYQGHIIELKNVKLSSDGAIELNGEKIYSFR